jgi:hypothetical protein
MKKCSIQLDLNEDPQEKAVGIVLAHTLVECKTNYLMLDTWHFLDLLKHKNIILLN